MNVDSFDNEAICHTVHAFYDRTEYPTLDKLLHVLKEIKGGCISLWKLVRKIGFRYKKVNDSTTCKSSHTSSISDEFLRRMRHNGREDQLCTLIKPG